MTDKVKKQRQQQAPTKTPGQAEGPREAGGEEHVEPGKTPDSSGERR
jgi:hypothetical protein